MIKLAKALKAWGTPEFETVLKNEIQKIDVELLPLQDGLSQSSHVGEGTIDVIILNVTDTLHVIHAKTGVIYTGVIAGSCCDDDPTPVSEQTEYCEIHFYINKITAESTVTVLKN